MAKPIKGIWLLALCVIAGCASKRGFDENGNPIFHSVGVKDTTFGHWSVDAYYYTIIGNINNRNTSVFISENPTLDNVWDFALNKPSYHFIVHKNHEASYLVMLIVERQEKRTKWSYFVTDGKGKSRSIETTLRGSLTEHRFIELFHKKADPPYQFMEKEKGLGVPNHHRIFYLVVPFSKILEDFNEKIMGKIESGEI